MTSGRKRAQEQGPLGRPRCRGDKRLNGFEAMVVADPVDLELDLVPDFVAEQ